MTWQTFSGVRLGLRGPWHCLLLCRRRGPAGGCQARQSGQSAQAAHRPERQLSRRARQKFHALALGWLVHCCQ